MKNIYRFGIDIDGTVTDPATFIPALNEHFKRELTLDDITEYDLSRVLGITKEDFWTFMKQHEGSLYSQAKLASEAKKTLLEWERKHELFYISARNSRFADLTKDWFDTNQLPYHHIELIGKHDKIGAVKKHDVHAFFEDKHDNAVNIAEECDIPVVLMNTPYNQEPVPKLVHRVNSWQEARETVRKLFG
nr:nucleotidase [Alteribacter aurantiacus]